LKKKKKKRYIPSASESLTWPKHLTFDNPFGRKKRRNDDDDD
jgi:hypothetical protein